MELSRRFCDLLQGAQPLRQLVILIRCGWARVAHEGEKRDGLGELLR